MLQLFGSVALLGGVLSLITGKTYFRGIIDRYDAPFNYWSNTVGLCLLGGMVWLGVLFC